MDALRQCTRQLFARRNLCCARLSPALKASSMHRQSPVSRAWTDFVRTKSSLSGKAVLAPRSFPTSGFEVIGPEELVEEETLPGYKAEMYYPVHIGQVFNERYQVLGKLGYGVTSTVWLARDLVYVATNMHLPRDVRWKSADYSREPDNPGYVALKIYVAEYTRINEVAIYERINSVSAVTEHDGYKSIRKFISSFEVQGPHGKHTCIVHEVLGITMEHLLDYLPKRSLRLQEVKPFLRQLIIALDFLHTQAGVIHTDLQLKNLLLPVSDPLFYKEFEEGECDDPSSRKILEDRTIYCSRYMSQSFKGLPLICDFGEARFVDQHCTEDIMPDVYRAPEVVMRMKWDYKVDIWSIAMVAWDFVAPRTLFHRLNPQTGEADDTYLIAEMAAVMGTPPAEYRHRSPMCSAFWDENGKWKDMVSTPDITLEKLAADVEGENKEGFLRFLRRILRWLPEDRPTTEELIFDPWLIEGLGLTDDQVKELQKNN